MATINYAAKYAPQVDMRFTHGAITNGLVNQNFDWIGVQTVKVFSRALTALNNYQASGLSRYGTPEDLGNDVQEMTLGQDKSLTYIIDKKTEQDTMGTMEAAATLAENIDNVVVPALDTYRIATLCANVPAYGSVSGASHVLTTTITKANAYEEFLKAQEILDNDLAPQGGRVCICTPAYYNFIKLDPNFTKTGDLATKIALNGQVGEIDGVPVIKAPARYFPVGVDFIITNPVVAPSPVKLQEFKIHDDAPGISGWLVEARFRYDCFVLNKKRDAIVVHGNVTGYDRFTAVTSPAGNPKAQGWFEKSGSVYSKTEDTTVTESKTYYELH